MLPPEFGTPWFCTKSQDPAWRHDENSSMHFNGQVVNQSSEPFDECPINVCDHELNYNSDASSMTFAISVSLGLDVTSSSFSTDCSTFHHEPLLAGVAPMQLYEKEQAALAPSSDQHPPSEQSILRDRGSALKIQNTNGGSFEIRQPAALKRLIADDSRTCQSEPPPTGLLSTEITDELPQTASNVATSVNPMPTPKIARAAEPLSSTDRHPTSVPPFIEVPNLTKPCESLLRKDFSSSRHSRTHPRTNSEEERLTCDICNETFPTSYILTRHERTHTDKKHFSCDICHKRFTENYLLKRHMMIHTGQKKFACNFCNKAFMRNESLVRHTRRHTGEKPFACHVCDKKFARDDARKNHARTHKKNRVSRNDVLLARTAPLEFDKRQQAYVDAPTILVVYPTIMPSDVVILVNANTAEMDVRKQTLDSHRRYETLVR